MSAAVPPASVTDAALPVLEHPAAGVVFAPVRHHSPTCARAVADAIAELAPAQVLIEAPRDIAALIPVLADPETLPPIAVVALEAEPARGRKAVAGDVAEADEATPAVPRALSYYPLCAYSPEYVAIRAAHARGAHLAFIDLPSGHRMMHGGLDPVPTASFVDERRLSYSDYVKALGRATGCRDHNEVWDHLFEQRLAGAPWREVLTAVAAYCTAVRATLPASELEADGTFAREVAMRAAIGDALARPERPILIVTGGLHTPALIAALAGHSISAANGAVSAPEPITAASNGATGDAAPKARAARAQRSAALARPPPGPPAIVTRAYVVRYGFKELDRLNGYAAGMPSPGYYQRVWERMTAADSPATGAAAGLWRDLAAERLVAFAAHLRAERPDLMPPFPALADTLEHAVRLSELRGTPGPGRQDLIDAVAACLVKGESLPGGRSPIVEEWTTFLSGDAIGNVPPSAGSPPLVENVRRIARGLGFDLATGTRRKRELDIYRNDRHLAASRFLHALAFLGTGYATRVAGPDILHGHARDILFETWQVAWSPMVEAQLVALAVHGDDLPTVLAARLARAIAETEAGPGGAPAGVRLLMTTCLIGLQDRSAGVMAMVRRMLEADASLATVATALSELFLSWRSRHVLGLAGSPDLEQLIGAAFRRALYLSADIANARADRLGDVLSGLATLREVVVSAAGETGAVDPAAFDEAIGQLVAQPMAPTLAGAVAALSYLAGQSDGAFLVSRMRGHLAGAYTSPADKVAALGGMIAMTRELLWRVPDLIAELDQTVAGLEEELFLEALPDLRLTFAALNPTETDAVARQVSAVRGGASIATSIAYDIGAEEVAANLALDLACRRGLTADGLGRWLGPSGDTTPALTSLPPEETAP